MPPNQLHTPVEALRFAIDFVQMDVGRASRAELKTAELRVRQLIALRMDQPDRHDWAGQGWAGEPPVPRTELERLHDDGRTFLMGAVMSGAAVVALELRFSVVRAHWSGRSSAPRTDYDPGVWIVVNGSPRDLFLYRVIRLLDELGTDKLHTCLAPDCGRLFFKVTRKEFCSTRCQTRTYMRKRRQEARAEKPVTIRRSRYGKTRTK